MAVTKPLLEILNKEELYAVLAHEVGHARHFDVEIMTALGLIPTALGLTANILQYIGMAFIAEEDLGALLVGAVFWIAGFILLLATLFIELFLLWFNKLRETYADYHAAWLLGPHAVNLARALAKIQVYMSNIKVDPFRGPVLTVPPMKIKEADPDSLLSEWLKRPVSPYEDILSIHPHTAKRIRALLQWSGAAPPSNH